MIKYLFVMRNNPCVLRTRKRNSEFKGNKWNCTSFVFSSRDCFVIVMQIRNCGVTPAACQTQNVKLNFIFFLNSSI